MSTTEGPMSFRPYREAVESGEFVPTPYSLEVDQILRDIKAQGREANPEYWTNLGMYGWTFFHPLQKDNSLTEYTTWVNRGLGSAYFGAGTVAPGANAAGTNTVDNNYFTEQDVRNLYQEILGRQPEPAGLQYWMERAGYQTLEELRYNIENSPEALGNQNDNTTTNNEDGPDRDTWVPSFCESGYEYPDGVCVPVDVVNEGQDSNDPADPPGNGNGDNDDPIGWYWANGGGGNWQWFPFYQGEGAPANAGYVSATAEAPTGPPAGWTDPNQPDEPEPEPETLYTPEGSMFFNGMFTANDILNRDGGEVQSPYYANARQNVLDQLALQAAGDGRTQNTKQEIEMAQNSAPGFSASGLFNPDYLSLIRNMGLGGR